MLGSLLSASHTCRCTLLTELTGASSMKPTDRDYHALCNVAEAGLARDLASSLRQPRSPRCAELNMQRQCKRAWIAPELKKGLSLACDVVWQRPVADHERRSRNAAAVSAQIDPLVSRLNSAG